MKNGGFFIRTQISSDEVLILFLSFPLLDHISEVEEWDILV